MMGPQELAPPAVTISEAQAYVRIETGEEEAVLAALIRSATELCEAFLGQFVVARSFSSDVPASGKWERLDAAPVQSIVSVDSVDASGATAALPISSYSIDIDSNGDGWIRITDAGGGPRVRVGGIAGLAQDENGVPEAIRQGVLRLVAHLFTARDGDGGQPPAAVTALWRPYRRMRVS